jgi:hypothetical protein
MNNPNTPPPDYDDASWDDLLQKPADGSGTMSTREIEQAYSQSHASTTPYTLTTAELARRLEDPPLLATELHPYPHLSKHEEYSPIDEMSAYLRNASSITLPLDRRGILSYDELVSMEVQEDDFLMEPFLSRSGLSTIAGPPDSGKSTFCRQLAMSIGLGLDSAFGFKLNLKHKHAVYWNSEDFYAQVKKVSRKQKERLSPTLSPDLSIMFSVRYASRELPKALEMLLREKPADLVVLDGFGDMLDGKDGNANNNVRAILEPYFNIAMLYKTHILVVTHVNKGTYDLRPDQKNLQGGSAYGQKVRCSLELRNNRNTGVRSITCTKGNELKEDLKRTAYKLEFDEQSMTFHYNGENISLDATVNGATTSVKKVPQLNVHELFNGESKMKRHEILEAISESFDCSESTAARALKNAVDCGALIRGAYGYYHLPDTPNDEPVHEEIEDPFSRVTFD